MFHIAYLIGFEALPILLSKLLSTILISRFVNHVSFLHYNCRAVVRNFSLWVPSLCSLKSLLIPFKLLSKNLCTEPKLWKWIDFIKSFLWKFQLQKDMDRYRICSWILVSPCNIRVYSAPLYLKFRGSHMWIVPIHVDETIAKL